MKAISFGTLYNLHFSGEPVLSPRSDEFLYVHTFIDEEANGYASVIRRVNLETLVDRPLTQGGAGQRQAVQDKNPSFSPDEGKIAFVSNRSGKNQLYIMPLDGGEAKPVTSFPDGVISYAWSPDGHSLVVTTRSRTDGILQDVSCNASAETTVKAELASNAKSTVAPDVRVIRHLRYRGNGEGFYDGKPVHLWLVELEAGDVRQLTFGPYSENEPAFSPDGKSIAFVSWRSDEEQEVTPSLYTVELATGALKQVYQGKGMTSAPAYSPDGRYIAFFGHQRGERSGENSCVWIVPSTGGEASCLTSHLDRPQGTVVGTDARFETAHLIPVWSANSDRIYFIATSEGNASVYSVSVSGDIRIETADEPCVATAFAASAGGPLIVAEESPTCPAEIFMYRNGQRQQLTHHNSSLSEEYAVAEPERFDITARDGLTIPGWVLRPANFEDGRKYPLILEIHGGPHSSYGNSFNHEFQLLAAEGYVVLYMNPRGSHGYGEQFVQGCVGDWGGRDYEDLMDAVDEAVKLPYVDENQLFVTGGSYGGFMTNWIVSHTDRFKAAVTQRSICNLYSMYGTSDIGFWFNKAELGDIDLWDAEELIMQRSPIRYAKNVKTPTKIIHSEEDYRCPMEQAEQWFTALKRLGVETEFVRFGGENHDLSRNGKPSNRIQRLKHIADWFATYRLS
ncbi:S9 family peptidase (plasmid) [Alicyclobacillus fastidiosus]|uniref:S9 family peptidase n=1 Tax=Alicyclobacillus fastidiosus TaxID=392011 RepID=A0ABY6ZPT4_9BACL|nr:S9 family peptidase [Alicyclobacillus fastidiosus]WAH44851.1 S9 family peptidase [Alicyclobacillus fastidiosus]GMA65820.1 putative peptidase YuxL [Alicyclobacillus fastidiosus]GMA65892.1 putative peptidase YuxL [Alicyclobacillus fastidiosus]